MLAAGACGPLAPGRGPETTFTQNGYTVTCQWTGSAINAGGAPSIGPEAESFCRSRAREAVGTLLTTNPGAQVQSVTISSNGSAEVCYGTHPGRHAPRSCPASPTRDGRKALATSPRS